MQQDIHAQRILIIDFGSQYTQLIARRVRDIGVYCEIYPAAVTIDQISNFNPNGIILSGGPESVTAGNAPIAPAGIFNLEIPVLGICYGMQVIATQLGGKVSTAKVHEFGYAQIISLENNSLLTGIKDHVDKQGNTLLAIK